MDPFIPKYKLVPNEKGRLFCSVVSLRILALSLRRPLNPFSNLRATLRLDGSSTMRLTTACNPDQGILGPVLLPGTLRLKAALSQTWEVLWGWKKFPNHIQTASKGLHIKYLLVGLVGWKSRVSSYSAFKICIMLSISRFKNFIKIQRKF